MLHTACWLIVLAKFFKLKKNKHEKGLFSLCAVAAMCTVLPAFSAENVKPLEQTKLAAPNPFEIPATAGGVETVLTITGFAIENGQLVAQGVIEGVGALITLPVAPTATCEILTLEVGAIHLDLLGLVVDVAAIDIDVTAVAAPGNLLGNLLCAITNLLNNPADTLSGVVGVLNRILDIF